MNAERTEQAVREALATLQQYLSDTIPPLSAAGPVSLLLEHPAPLAASEIQAWTAAQRRSGGGKASVGDYVFTH